MDSRGRVVTVSGLRMEVTRFGELKIGNRILDDDEGDKVAETVAALTNEARAVRRAIRRPRSRSGEGPAE